MNRKKVSPLVCILFEVYERNLSKQLTKPAKDFYLLCVNTYAAAVRLGLAEIKPSSTI